MLSAFDNLLGPELNTVPRPLQLWGGHWLSPFAGTSAYALSTVSFQPAMILLVRVIFHNSDKRNTGFSWSRVTPESMCWEDISTVAFCWRNQPLAGVRGRMGKNFTFKIGFKFVSNSPICEMNKVPCLWEAMSLQPAGTGRERASVTGCFF